MNVKRYVISVIAVFVFVFAYEFLVHGYLLKCIYEQTAELWRSHEEHKMIFILLSYICFAAVAAYIFTCNYEGKGIGEGARFGLYIGLLLGSVEIGTYSYLPISLILMVSWVAAAILKGVGSGIVLSLTYKKRESVAQSF